MSTFIRCAAAAALLCATLSAHAQTEPANSVKFAAAHIAFRHSGSDLSGPPGTTPPGLGSEAGDVSTLGFAYARRLNENWSVELSLGVPPKVKVHATGSGAALGQVGTFEANSPALTVSWFLPVSGPVRPYIGAGIHHTWFDHGEVSPAYNAAFGGAGTSASLTSSTGGVVKIGAEIALHRRWFIDVVAQHYWMRTTATLTTDTPGVGPIPRTTQQVLDPTIFAVGVGYRF